MEHLLGHLAGIEAIPRNYLASSSLGRGDSAVSQYEYDPLTELLRDLKSELSFVLPPDALALVSLQQTIKSEDVWAGVYVQEAVSVRVFSLPPSLHNLASLHDPLALLHRVTMQCSHTAPLLGVTAQPGGKLCLVMPGLQEGLQEMLHCGTPLAPWHALQLCADVLCGLAELHQLGVVVADLQPERVLLHPLRGACVVTACGLEHVFSRLRGEPQTAELPNYMAPEQFDSTQLVSPAADVWAFACLALHMLQGQAPWSGSTMVQICMQVGVGGAQPPVPTDLPQGLSALLSACLNTAPASRPTAFQALQQVRGIMAVAAAPQLGLPLPRAQVIPATSATAATVASTTASHSPESCPSSPAASPPRSTDNFGRWLHAPAAQLTLAASAWGSCDSVMDEQQQRPQSYPGVVRSVQRTVSAPVTRAPSTLLLHYHKVSGLQLGEKHTFTFHLRHGLQQDELGFTCISTLDMTALLRRLHDDMKCTLNISPDQARLLVGRTTFSHGDEAFHWDEWRKTLPPFRLIEPTVAIIDWREPLLIMHYALTSKKGAELQGAVEVEPDATEAQIVADILRQQKLWPAPGMGPPPRFRITFTHTDGSPRALDGLSLLASGADPAAGLRVAPAEPLNLSLKIRTRTGKTVPLYGLADDCFVLDVMKKFAEIEGIPADQQRLVWEGQPLEPSCTLQDYNVQAGAVVDLMLMLRC